MSITSEFSLHSVLANTLIAAETRVKMKLLRTVRSSFSPTGGNPLSTIVIKDISSHKAIQKITEARIICKFRLTAETGEQPILAPILFALKEIIILESTQIIIAGIVYAI